MEYYNPEFPYLMDLYLYGAPFMDFIIAVVQDFEGTLEIDFHCVDEMHYSIKGIVIRFSAHMLLIVISFAKAAM